LDHLHPAFPILDQAQLKGLPQAVAGPDQVADAPRLHQIPQAVPTQIKAVCEGFDQPLLCAGVAGWWIKERFQLL
jgi:hypothetical protein